MYTLYLLICVGGLGNCNPTETIGTYSTLVECEKAMKERIDETKVNEALLCFGEEENINT